MQSILESARRALGRDPSPGLPLSELHRRVAAERSGPVPGPGRLLERLRARPDLFRVVEPWRGTWNALAEPGSSYRRRLGASGLSLEPWIAPAGDRRRGPSRSWARTPSRRMGASVGFLGRSLDRRTPTAGLRWVAMARQTRRTAAELRRADGEEISPRRERTTS